MFSKTTDPLFLRWRENSDDATKAKLDAMSNSEAADAFGALPSFGTGGIRNPEGIGPNRINLITIRWAAAALARSLTAIGKKGAVLIGYDTRHNSKAYAEETTFTLNRYGIPVALFDEPTPVPLLSFALKQGNYLGGVMITASHNEPTDNGFKVYDPNGAQYIPVQTKILEQYIQTLDPFSIHPLRKSESLQRGLFHITGKAEKAAYLSAIAPIHAPTDLSVVATPLHGAAFRLLPDALKRSGHKVTLPTEQMNIDGRFFTVKAPNPEDPKVFQIAERLGRQCNADLLLATDGDGDRCGCCIKKKNDYIPLSGNDTAALLLYYLTNHKKYPLPKNGYVARTAVSGTLGTSIAQKAGLKTILVPTGFKYIGAAATEKANGTFFAGYEESGGFLYGGHAADKDGIATAVLLAEAAAYYKKQGKTLFDIQEEIHSLYGREYSETLRFFFPGSDGLIRRKACLKYFRQFTLANSEKSICGDTVFFDFGADKKAALRLSGTEPYLKLYCIVKAGHDAAARSKMEAIQTEILPIINKFLSLTPQKAEC